MNKREIALSYLKKGFSVIPLKSPSIVNNSTKFKQKVQDEYNENLKMPEPRSWDEIHRELFYKECKSPLVSWKEYQKRLPTEEEINNWFNLNPDANIGIVTGRVSNLVVFDFDSASALEYAQETGGLPESTAVVKTCKGFHFYMRHPDFDVSSHVNTDLGLDIRAEGGYVVAHPSVHGSGKTYEWLEGSSILDIEPAPCTQWMIDYLKNASTGNKPASTKKETKELPKKAETIQPERKETETNGYADLLKNGCSQGGRNKSAISLVGHLFKTDMKDTEIWEMIQIWNRNQVKPPLGHDELKTIFESVRNAEQKTKEAKTIKIDSLLDDVNKAISEYQQNHVMIPFAGDNLSKLESHMNGGFIGGRLYIFGGIPSAGKTVLLNNIADNICLKNYPVLFFSYDDGMDELLCRTFSRFAGKDIEELNQRTCKNIESIGKLPEVKNIRSLKYIVKQMFPVERWHDLIEQIKKKHGKPPVIILDYLRKLKSEKSNGDERLRVDGLLSSLTDIAKIHNTPVIAISELARDSYKSGQRLSMASFKESGTIEYEASWLGILAAVEEGKNGEYIIKENWEHIIKYDGNIDLIVFKAKRGTGATGRVQLKVDKKFMTVTERQVVSTQPEQIKKNHIKTKY
jgi:replicative DNA helicase